jgi:parallel beta-helix repeat protein
VVSSLYTLDNTIKDLRADLLIENGGELRITNATLVMNCSKSGDYSITVKPGGKLFADHSNITYGPSKAWYEFTVNGAMELRDSDISGTTGMFDQGGVFIASSDVTVTGCHFHDHQWYAMIINGSSPTISGCTIDHCKSGIRVENGGSPVVSGTTFRDNQREGMIVLDSKPIIRDNQFRNNTKGIGLYQSDADISGNAIIGSSTVGIECVQLSDAKIAANTITGNGQAGISVIYSSPTITSNTITSNGMGINSSVSRAAIRKNTIGGNSGWGIYAVGGAPSLDSNKFTDDSGNANALGSVAIIWALNIKVIDSNKNPVAGADVTVKDKSGNVVYSGKTGDDGTVPALELLQTSRYETGTRIETPHKIAVKWQDLADSIEVTMDKDQSITAQLQKPSEKGFLPGPDLLLTGVAVLLVLLVMRRVHCIRI